MAIIINKYINIEKDILKKTVKTISKPIIYSPSDYNIPNKYKGHDVKIALIDSGCPKHQDIKINAERISFCENNKNVYDKYGHATLVTGIIKAKNKHGITGLANYSQLYFAKVVDDAGKCSFNSIVAAVLWAIVKKVDIITIALGTQYDYGILKDVIKKAYNDNICIIAASGNDMKNIDFPARYPEVLSVGALLENEEDNKIIRKKVDIALPATKKYTTYTNNSYVKASGSSIATAFATSLASLLIEQHKEAKNLNFSPKKIYYQLKNLQK